MPVITIDPRDSRSYQLGLTVSLTWSEGGTSYQTGFSWNTGKPSAYWHDTIVQLGDLVKDNSGFGRMNFTVAADKPHRVLAVVAGTYTSYNTLHQLIAAHPAIFRATVDAHHYVKTGAVENEDEIEVFTGRLVAMSHITVNTITFEVEHRLGLQLKHTPQRTLSRVSLPSGNQDKLIKGMDGEAFPVALGAWVPEVSGLWSGNFASASKRYWWPLLGFEPSCYPVLPAMRGARYSIVNGNPTEFIYLERVTGGLSRYTVDPSFQWYVRIGDNWARLASTYGSFPGMEGVQIDDWADAYLFETNERPWVEYAIRPLVKDTVYYTPSWNVDLSIDGDPRTYATIPHNGVVRFQVPEIQALGKLSTNSTDSGTGSYDFQGAGYPRGLRCHAILVTPLSGTTPGSGECSLKFCFPNGTVLINDGTQSSQTPSASFYNTGGTLPAQIGDCPIYYRTTQTIGTANAGWAGTKFGQWDFTTHPDSTSPAQNRPLYYAGNETEQFEIWFTNNSGGPAYLSSVSFVIGCQLDTNPEDTKFGRGPIGYQEPKPGDDGRHGWGR